MEHGELCVMITGVVWMQVWPANNWASLVTVSFLYQLINYLNDTHRKCPAMFHDL